MRECLGRPAEFPKPVPHRAFCRCVNPDPQRCQLTASDADVRRLANDVEEALDVVTAADSRTGR